MLICNSAGNEGGKKWNYIGAPADAKDILSVGAVNVQGKRAYFSSFGPTADGRIKPDACAVGRNTYLSTPKGIITVADGTSFSSPMLSGMVACLWQAFPGKSCYEIMEAVHRAGSHNVSVNGDTITAPDPDDGYGYGITDFLRAYNILKYGNEDDVLFLAYSRDMIDKTSNQFTAIVKSISQEPYSTLTVTATPLTYRDGKAIEGKPVNVKVAKEIVNIKLGLSGLGYVITLPKLSKKQPYQLYRVDFVIDGKTVSRIVGLEQPVE
jgi:subtilisin family serine protease